MALKTFRPTTPSTRQLVLVDRSHLHKGRPVKGLTEHQHSSGGRNSDGRITTRHIGGGHKQAYRKVDFKRRKRDLDTTPTTGTERSGAAMANFFFSKFV